MDKATDSIYPTILCGTYLTGFIKEMAESLLEDVKENDELKM